MATPSFPPVHASPARPRTHRKTAVGVLLMVLGTILALVGPSASPAGALTNDGMTSISNSTDPTLATYPTGIFPEGCAVTDGQVLIDHVFTASGPVTAGPVADMRDLPYLPAGTTLTMTWAGWVEGCETPISLSTKRAVGPEFDETTDQALLAFEGCGPEGFGVTVCGTNGDGRFTLSLLMPQLGADCNYQNDAVVGPPLDVVGPDGSFYGNGLRVNNGKTSGPTMLISADNAGPAEVTGAGCQPPSAQVACSATGVRVTVTNPDSFDDIFVDVLAGSTADNVAVVPGGELVQVTQDGGTAFVDIPLGIGEHPFIQVVDAQRNIYGPTQFTENCATPQANATVDCAEDGSITITYSSTGPQAVTFTATINGTDVPLDAVDPQTGEGTTTVPMTADPSTVAVSANGTVIFTSDPLSCDSPSAAVVVDCAENTITVTITPGDDPTDTFVVTANGTELEITDNVATTTIDLHDVEIVVTADDVEILRQTVEHCDHLVAACVAGKSTVERFTAEDVYTHYDGQFAVNIDEATGTWTSAVPIDFIMVVENNTTVRSFVLPGNFTSGSFTANTVTVTVNGSPVVINGVITDGNGNPVSTGDIGTISSVTYCDGTETTTTTPPVQVAGVQQTQAGALPRTGSEDSGRMALALGFIVTGLGLVLLGEDRRLGLLLHRR